MRQKEKDFDVMLNGIRSMPRRPLHSHSEKVILDHLRQWDEQSSQRSKSRRTLQNTFIFSSIAVGLAILLFLPALMDKALDSRWLSAIFPKSTSTQVIEVSPKFDLLDKDGKVVYPETLRGIEGKIAFMENGDFVAKSPETVSKIFWFAWGDPKKLKNARLSATAVNLATNEDFLLNDSTFGGPVYGEDASAITSFNPFPSKGNWRLDVKLNGQYYASIVVAVKDEYIHTDTARFYVSMDDAVTGSTETILILPGHNLAETIDVRVFPVNHKDQVKDLTFTRGEEYIQAMGPITHYSGTLQFNAPGIWQVEVLGENTIIKVRER